MQAVGHTEAVTFLYRAVARAELDDLAQTGFRQHPDGLSMESKLFTTSPEGAATFGRDNFRFDEVPFHLIDLQVLIKTINIARRMQHPHNLNTVLNRLIENKIAS